MTVHSTIETDTDQVLAHVDGDAVGWITLNNPSRHNTLSGAMRDALPHTVDALAAHPGVRVIVITGAGDLAFSAGADISEFREQRTRPTARAEYDRGSAAWSAVWSSIDKPVIAMINGYCLGGGLLLALQTDIRIASNTSQFAIPAARVGLGYPASGVSMLLGMVGPAWTSEILFSGRRLTSDEAVRIGLVNRVVPADELLDEVRTLARTIAENAPLTITACKAAIRELRKEPATRNMDPVEAMIDQCFDSADYLEGQSAFREKRAPRFSGH